MTIKEFAAKYCIPYHVAYKASFTVKPIATIFRDRDFKEDELYRETRKYIRRRLTDIRSEYQQYVNSWKNINNKGK